MEISTVKAHIKTKSIKPFYVFTGPEVKVQDIYIQKIGETKNVPIKSADTISEIYNKMLNRSFVSSNFLYVVREDKDFMTYEKAWPEWENIIGENTVIMRCANIDKRSKFYKHFKDAIVVFEPLKDDILKKYIQKEINLSDKACIELIDICEADYSRILLEVDKIKTYANALNMDGALDVCMTRLIDKGVIFRPSYDAIWDFVSAVLDRKCKTSFDLLAQAYDYGEATMVLLSVLYSNIKKVLQVQCCQSSDIANTTGLSGWDIKNAKMHIGHYTAGELINAMRIIREAEKGIKTGIIEDAMAVPYILVHIL